MSRFITPLTVTLLSDQANDGRGSWQLALPLEYESDILGGVITVPAGFITDFASTPNIVGFFTVGCHEAATIHDYLYTTTQVPRSMADAILEEACEVSGVEGWRADLIESGVRVFGAGHFGTP